MDEPQEGDRPIKESFLARLGLLGTGSLLVGICSDVWSRVGPNSPGEGLFLLAIWVCLLGGLGLMGAALISSRPTRLNPLLLALVVFAQWSLFSAYAVTETNFNSPSDTVTVSLHAAILNSLGENPYGYPMTDVFSAYEATGISMTPHLDGAQVEYLPYPPLHFLSLRPFVPWGLEGARFFYTLCHTALLVLLFAFAPARYRGVVLIPLILNPEFIHYPFYWSSDSVWTLMLALMLWNWKRPYVRGVLLGLACAYKQTPWLFAPFLAARILKEEERPWKAVGVFFGTSFGTFLVFNLPYALDNFGAWFQGTFDPMLSPYISLGRGFSMLTQTGLLSFGKPYYGVITLLMFVCAFWFYLHNFRWVRPLLWWFPALVLFFSYRSLQHYFIYSVPFLVMELSRHDFDKSVERPKHWYLPLATAAAGFLIATAVYWPAASQVDLKVVQVAPNDAEISRAEVVLTNNSQQEFRPNFYARNNWRTYPWFVIDGPLILKAGETARYRIGTDLNYRIISGHSGGQILVGDGEGDLGYRAIADLPRWDSMRYPRGFDSPPSILWGKAGNVWYENREVYFSVSEDFRYASVSRSMALPLSPLSFEMLRPEDFPGKASFGLEVSDQQGHKISVLMSDSSGQGHYSSRHFYKLLPSKPGWNSYTIDIRSLYEEAGFPLPNLDRIVRNDVELIDRPVSMLFQLYSARPVKKAGLRNVQLVRDTAPGHRIADLARDKAAYRAVLGDFAARRRQFDKAMKLYSEAWPMDSQVRTTQEASFLVLPGPQKLRGRFAMAGWGWGEPELFESELARPITGLLGTIPVLARPGLKMRLEFAPETSYSVRWDDQPWIEVAPGESFEVPEHTQIRTISVVPDRSAGLKGITVLDPSGREQPEQQASSKPRTLPLPTPRSR